MSALTLAVVAASATLGGFPFYHAFIGVTTVIAFWEWQRICGAGGPPDAGTTALGVLGTAGAVVLASTGRYDVALWVPLITLAVAYLYVRLLALPEAGWSAAGAIYVGLPCLALLWIFDRMGGYTAIVWLVVVVTATDTGAYFAGRKIGGPKLAPTLSPGKTWAGLAGGVVGAALVSGLWALWQAPAAVASVTVAGAALGCVAQGGDLLESAVKRRFGVKDSSDIIPGHGGLLDRVDGLILGAVALAAANLSLEKDVLAWL